jgi:hypothetical protein
MLVQGGSDGGPDFAQVRLAVLWEERGKGGFFQERLGIRRCFEWLYLPLRSHTRQTIERREV